MKTVAMIFLICVLIITTIFGYMHFNGSNILSKPIEPIEVFLNDPAAFRDFLREDNTTEAIAASPTTRRILTENADTAQALLNNNYTTYYEIKNQALADKAIIILKNNPTEFTKFFQDSNVATKIVILTGWEGFKLRLSFPDLERELELMKIKTRIMEGQYNIR